jgi:hypothetical protein
MGLTFMQLKRQLKEALRRAITVKAIRITAVQETGN